MTQVIKRALKGDKISQDDCTARKIILPCPFCGLPAECRESGSKVTRDSFSVTHSIGCFTCGVMFTRQSTFKLNTGSIVYEKNGFQDALELWNRRKGLD